MKLDFDKTEDSLNISAYSATGIIAGGRLQTRPFVISGSNIVLDLLPSSVSDFTADHMTKLTKLGQNIIIIGTGEHQILLDGEVMQPAYDCQIGLEVMTTAAACRCFNVLIGESRAVAGAFYML